MKLFLGLYVCFAQSPFKLYALFALMFPCCSYMQTQPRHATYMTMYPIAWRHSICKQRQDLLPYLNDIMSADPSYTNKHFVHLYNKHQ